MCTNQPCCLNWCINVNNDLQAFNGNLLGVIGTDVPLKELIKLTPQYKVSCTGDD